VSRERRGKKERVRGGKGRGREVKGEEGRRREGGKGPLLTLVWGPRMVNPALVIRLLMPTKPFLCT